MDTPESDHEQIRTPIQSKSGISSESGAPTLREDNVTFGTERLTQKPNVVAGENLVSERASISSNVLIVDWDGPDDPENPKK